MTDLAVEMTDAMRRYQEERLAQRPEDRALWVLGRPYTGCKSTSPCKECVEEGREAAVVDLDGTPVQQDDLLLPS